MVRSHQIHDGPKTTGRPPTPESGPIRSRAGLRAAGRGAYPRCAAGRAQKLRLDPSQNVGVDGWSDLRDRFVAPFYLHCLNGNLVSLESNERQQLVQDMREVAPDFTIEAAKVLWAYEWRGAWMASWWTGVWRWPSWSPRWSHN